MHGHALFHLQGLRRAARNVKQAKISQRKYMSLPRIEPAILGSQTGRFRSLANGTDILLRLQLFKTIQELTGNAGDVSNLWNH